MNEMKYENIDELSNNLDGNLDGNLDDKWIKEFENNDKLYRDFYKNDVHYINLHFVYVNKMNEIEKISNEQYLLSSANILLHNELIKILKMYSVINNTRYSLLSILRYNITISPDEITNFVKTNHDTWYTNYISIIKNISDIKFDKTINIFQDLNDLTIVFYEKHTDKNSNTYTKRIHINKKHKKTIRKTT
jgi:hypothetical protein